MALIITKISAGVFDHFDNVRNEHFTASDIEVASYDQYNKFTRSNGAVLFQNNNGYTPQEITVIDNTTSQSFTFTNPLGVFTKLRDLEYPTSKNFLAPSDLGVLVAKQEDLDAVASGFQGSLAIADTPTNDGYFLASESGTYTNAGNLVVDNNGFVNYIIRGTSGGSYELISIEIPGVELAPAFDPLNNDKGVTGKQVADNANMKSETVIEKDTVISSSAIWQIVDLLGNIAVKLSENGDFNVLKLVAENAEVTDLISNVLRAPELRTEDNLLRVMDAFGNYNLELSSEGLRLVKMIANETEVSTAGIETANISIANIVNLLASELTSSVLKADESLLRVMDALGNYVLEVNNEGIDVVGLKINGVDVGSNTGWLQGKTFVSAGDSLFASNYVQNDMETYGGAISIGNYSAGGTTSFPNGSNSTQDRVKQFIADAVAGIDYTDSQGEAQTTNSPDFMLLENVNDDWSAVNLNPNDLTEKPFFISQYSIFDNGFATMDAAVAYWVTNFNDVIATVGSQIKGTCIRLAYDTNSVIIDVTSGATSTGTITIDVGATSYATAITSGMTATEVAEEIYITNYVGYSKSISGSTITLTQTEEGAGAVSVSENDTGATIALSTGSSTAYVNRYFMGTTSGEFSTQSNWQDTVTLVGLYKGIIEELQREFPKMKLVWMIPTKYAVGWEVGNSAYNANWMNADGTFNYSDFYSASNSANIQFRYPKLIAIQLAICKAYNIIPVDCTEDTNISLFNVQTYYNQNNVHPIRNEGDDAYRLWTEATIKRINF